MPTIEKIFKQYTFANEHQKCHTGLLYISALAKKNFEAALKPYNITTKQYRILKALQSQYPEPIPVKNLREFVIDRESDVSRILTRLLDAGLVSRQKNSGDSRVSDITITKSGRELMTRIAKGHQDFFSAMNALDEESVRQLNQYLERILIEIYKS